jgi:hypothetical protein
MAVHDLAMAIDAELARAPAAAVAAAASGSPR